MDVPRRVHLLGVGGVGMGALAGLLHGAGAAVTGSDAREVYPPMSDLLSALGLSVFVGFRPENLEAAAPDLVVVGNVVRADNPEMAAVRRRGLPYLSLPEALGAFFLPGKTSLVVAGTHGKTTTSSLLAHALEALGEDPTYLVGGLLRSHGRNYRLGRGRFVVLEGDEYDTAFFDKRPKFVHYAPAGVVLTSVEFDHADIYPSLAHVERAFSALLEILPPGAPLAFASRDPGARRLASGRPGAVPYGGEGVVLLERRPLCDPPGQEVVFAWEGRRCGFRLPLIGAHNAENALGVIALLSGLGFDPGEVARALETFPGVRRRQEVLFSGEITVLDDFAHHPTAVRVTLEAVRETWPARRLVALFEPRTNTSRRRIFQEDYARALASADLVLLKAPPDLDKVPPGERLDLELLARRLRESGPEARAFSRADELWEALLSLLRPGDVCLFMSNGPFDNLPEKLTGTLSQGASAPALG